MIKKATDVWIETPQQTAEVVKKYLEKGGKITKCPDDPRFKMYYDGTIKNWQDKPVGYQSLQEEKQGRARKKAAAMAAAKDIPNDEIDLIEEIEKEAGSLSDEEG